MNRGEQKKLLQERIVSRLGLSESRTDEQILEVIEECVLEAGREQYMEFAEKRKLVKELFYSIRKLDFIQEVIDDTSVTEIMINGPNCIFVEREGKLLRLPERFESTEKLEDIIQQIVASCNRVVNESNPIVDARLENGSRVNIVLAPIALNGPIVTIRRFPEHPIQMEDLIRYGSITEKAAGFLEKLVKAGYNIFISGGTGSGKTTFLNALSQFIPNDERIITIEDSAELQIRGIPNLVRLETRNANVEGCHEISIRDLIKSSLRMRPDRIIVGEVRGSEAIDMIQCLNTGHDGSLSTGHANSARDMLSRLETMIAMSMDLPLAAIRGQLASGIDIIVHLGRIRDKSRRVLEIVEVLDYSDGMIHTQQLFSFEEEGEDENGKVLGEFEERNTLIHTEKLKAAGLPVL